MLQANTFVPAILECFYLVLWLFQGKSVRFRHTVASANFICTAVVEVEFATGNVYILSAEYLRILSPAADGKMRSIGGEKVIFGRRHVGIMSTEPIGNYGVRIVFDDLHKTGIYTWDYLYHLGSNKFSLMRNYIKTLKKHGLSRDPSRRK
ncbi:hypothetical protein CDL15_Pgr005659 [Punica granatum]|uniref:Gamma-butyrobetaine hydroxylase-like N-terminal domain-containing protein n=1 Tax=Punica granatum TaxID=22663 RepID=A0A218WHJ7_PUNGR|nr:hypothetical protein CDL15_Pgr005659 [Punica granatum]